MNAEDFYTEFKAALNYVGCGWGKKDEATIIVQGNIFTVTWQNRIAKFTIDLKENPDV